VLRKIFGLKRDEMVGGCREVHNEELHDLCCRQKRMFKSRRMRWAGHVTCMRAREREEECVEDFGGKTRRKQTTRKTKM
jgi:hypothetical protein